MPYCAFYLTLTNQILHIPFTNVKIRKAVLQTMVYYLWTYPFRVVRYGGGARYVYLTV